MSQEGQPVSVLEQLFLANVPAAALQAIVEGKEFPYTADTAPSTETHPETTAVDKVFEPTPDGESVLPANLSGDPIDFTFLPMNTDSNTTIQSENFIPTGAISNSDVDTALTSSPQDPTQTSVTDFWNETTTELPYYNEDYTYHDTGEENSSNGTNPFLVFDYDWYDNNNVTRGEDYVAITEEESAKKRDEALSVFDKVSIPPAVRPLPLKSRDLNMYFLAVPPITCLLVLVFAFMPCIFLKWRDDIREAMGKQRIWGDHGKRNAKKRQFQQVSKMH